MPRTLSALAIALILTLSAAAQDTWQLDPPHSSAQFSVRHLGVSTVRGAFTKVSGTVQYDPADLGKSSIQATIETVPWTHASRCATTICAARAFWTLKNIPPLLLPRRKSRRP